MNYIEVVLTYNNVTEDNSEIIGALLGNIDFESFNDFEQGIKAYIPEQLFNNDLLSETVAPIESILGELKIETHIIEQQNWNAEWEKNFDPIFIDDKCRIRAPFHDSAGDFEYDILIEPKMSFGTGHHATTSSMIRLISNLDCTNKQILDMGCGTGVLGILASLKGATKVMGIDIDNWAYLNSVENAQKNNISNFELFEGDVSLIKNKTFDIVLANINRNILLADLSHYAKTLSKNGLILISGFYTEDLPILNEVLEKLGFRFQNKIVENNWVAAQFIKTE